MICEKCKQRGKTWEGADPKCWNDHGTDNWNCATVVELRSLIADNAIYSEDDWFVTIDLRDMVDPEGVLNNWEALWVAWYKKRGCTNAMWLLAQHGCPQMPTEQQLLVIINNLNKKK